MKTLFVHNTIADYRIPFFVGLNDKIKVAFLFTRKDWSKKIYGNDLDVERINKLKYSYLPSGINRYKNIIEEVKKPEYNTIILPPMDTLSDFIDCLFFFTVAKMKKKKIMYFGEKWEAPRDKQPTKKYLKNSLQRNAMKSILRHIDICIVSGKKSFEYFEALGVKRDRIKVAIDASGMEIGVKLFDIREKYSMNKDDKIILYYGRIIERKGLDILLKAYNEINKNDNKTHLLVCGNGDEFKDTCVKMVSDLNIKNVIFEGYIAPENRYTYFSQSDIFVLPSYFHNGISEAWGLTVNEALQCGIPVIATEAVGAAYDLLNGKDGEMIKENSVEDLVRSMKSFLYEKDPSTVKEECLKVYKKYDYNNMINSFVDAINLVGDNDRR